MQVVGKGEEKGDRGGENMWEEKERIEGGSTLHRQP